MLHTRYVRSVRVPFYLVDAFADRPFSGNPAGVCLLDGAMDDVWMQLVASEINQAETAFVWPKGDRYGLRWFTPAVEVDLCGHATLAAAVALRDSGATGSRFEFDTKSGRLEAWPDGDEAIAMDFPAELGKEHSERGETYRLVEAALGQPPQWLGRNRMDWLAVLADPTAVREFKPDYALIARAGMRGLIVTAAEPSGGRYDYVCRFFAPQSGVDEDHVTGSAHCFLGPFWSSRLGKKRLNGLQVSPRGGLVDVELVADRAILRGRGKIVVRGEFLA